MMREISPCQAVSTLRTDCLQFFQSYIRTLGRLPAGPGYCHSGLLHQFEVPFGVVVNKYDLSAEGTASLEAWCQDHSIEVLGHIPFDQTFPTMLRQGKTVLAAENSEPAKVIINLWHKVSAKLTTGD